MAFPTMEIAERRYIMIIASGVARKRVYLEARDEKYLLLAEIYWDDDNNDIKFTAYEPHLTLPLVESMIEWAKDEYFATSARDAESPISNRTSP